MNDTAKRVRLEGLGVSTFEHPSDRAALSTLQKVPGFDILLRKFIGLVGEKSLRTIYLAGAVRVGEKQFPDLFAMYKSCIEVLDVKTEPELFVAQTPFVNAGAIGTERPFIVLNSGSLDLLSEDELRFILGHELGHILADHVLYKTMLKLLLRMTVLRYGAPISWLVLNGIIMALKEWDRKSELTADRAGLLAVQSPDAACGALMKIAGGAHSDQMSLEEFTKQADEYRKGGDKLDSFYKLINLLVRTHPFPVLRVGELRDWIDNGAYNDIINGEYQQRGDEEKRTLYSEIAASARSYRKSLEESEDPAIQFIKDLGKSFTDTSTKFVDTSAKLVDDLAGSLKDFLGRRQGD